GERCEYRLGYRGDIEGLRAIAVLFVIAVHAGVPGLSGGFVGVDIFFVLSGFLITGLLVKEITRTGTLQFADFYIRRMRRLLPALTLMLLGSGALAWLILAPLAQLPQAAAGASAAVWFSNVHFAVQKLDYFSPGTETNIFLHTWSLGVEEQFYLIWPALIYVLLRHADKARSGARLRVCMILVLVVSLVASIWATYALPQFAFYMMPLRAWQFALGALVWVQSQNDAGWLSRVMHNDDMRSAAGWLGLILLFATCTLLDANRPYPGFYALLPTLGAALVIASGSNDAMTSVQRCLSWHPMQAIGRISYSWYLWHWPALLLGNALFGSNAPIYRLGFVAFSLLMAVLSYRFVESPIRHQGWWLVHKRVTVYGAAALVALCIIGSSQWYRHAGDRINDPEQKRIAMSHEDSPVIYAQGCDDWYSSARVKVCAFGTPNAPHTAVLLGDSIAGQWFPAVVKVFGGADWRLLVLTKSSCPMVDQSIFYARIGRIYSECTTWRNAVLAYLAKIKPDVVVLSSFPNNALAPEQWVSGSQRVMQSLGAVATNVYVLRATPHLPLDGPDCLAEYAGRPKWLPQNNGDCSFPSKDSQADAIYMSIREAAKPFGNVHVVDMSDAICPGSICNAERNGMIVFRDSQHMTATFAASLALALGGRLQLEREPESDGHAKASR
ncbi:acyltransferase family protein, partial [Dyella sp.]|uniref:acyltransferase family protein n=1 Tax=Dyella sp. TaxID=1869338 RepID=UPI002BA6BFF9